MLCGMASFFMTPSMMGISHRESGGRRRSGDKLGRYHKHAWGRGGHLSQRDGAGDCVAKRGTPIPTDYYIK